MEGGAIVFIVALNVTLAVYSEHSAGQALQALLALAQPGALVLRAGVLMQISSEDVVVGDVLALHVGDVVAADVRLISSVSLLVNEMALTGESRPVEKSVVVTAAEVSEALTSPNVVLRGSTVEGGHGMALVVTTGELTQLGQIASLTERGNKSAGNEASRDLNSGQRCTAALKTAWGCIFSRRAKRSAMQHSVSRLGLGLSAVAIVVCTAVFVIGVGRQHRDIDEPDQEVWLGMLLVAVSLAVSAIPEGLPLAVTVCLTLGCSRLANKRTLVRRAAAVESLGSINVICTDKTGTLTQGKMAVVRLVVDGKHFSVQGRGVEPVGEVEEIAAEMESEVLLDGHVLDANVQSTVTASSVNQYREAQLTIRTELLDTTTANRSLVGPLLASRLALLCCNARLVRTDTGQWRTEGSPTEAAVTVLAGKFGLQAEQEVAEWPKLAELPFSSFRKCMFTVHRLQSEAARKPLPVDCGDAVYLTCGKGSADVLVPFCTRYVDSSGCERSMEEAQRQGVLAEVDRLACRALRVLAVVYKATAEEPFALEVQQAKHLEEKKEEEDTRWDGACSDLVFVGLLCCVDPLRSGVADAVARAKGAGVRTVMITGDHQATASAIGTEIGLIPQGVSAQGVVSCSALRPNGVYLADPELDVIVNNTAVFARAQPRDKLAIVCSLQRQGKVCAMTGDGTNDAPALKQADVGIAMGSGTDVAKAAASMVLLDDSFPTIVDAVYQGRVLYTNIQKFVVFLVATNSVQMAFILLCVAVGLPTPLTALQILFINLATDGLPALALSADEGEGAVMQAMPRRATEAIIHGRLKWLVLGHAVVLLCSLFTVYVTTLHWLGAGDAILQDDLAPSSASNDQLDAAKHTIDVAHSAVFLTLALAEMARPYTVRWYHHGWWYRLASNRWLLLASALSLTLFMLIMFVPDLQEVFHIVVLEGRVWGLAIAVVVLTIVSDEVVKWLIFGRSSFGGDSVRANTQQKPE